MGVRVIEAKAASCALAAVASHVAASAAAQPADGPAPEALPAAVEPAVGPRAPISPASARPPASLRFDATPQSTPLDYGRPEAPSTAGDGLIWVPRVLFFPLYVVTEYVIRYPFAAFTTFVEHHKVVETLKDIFIFGPHDNIGIVPTGLIDFGFRPSVGVYFFWDDFIAKDNGVRVHVATGGADYLRGTVTDTVKIDKMLSLKLRFEGTYRPDDAYFGEGPRSLEANRSRYVERTFNETLGFAAELAPGSGFTAYATVRDAHFAADGSYGSDPSLATEVAEGVLTLPSGFAGYTSLAQGLTASFDTRKPRPAPGSGVRLEAYGEHDFDLRDPVNSRWARWGGSIGGFVDLTGKNRVLSLSVTTQFADPLGSVDVPFDQLATLGGDNAPMHGFYQGRLLDRSAIAATLEYRWPVWSFLDGSAQYAVGNVFGAHFSGFEPDLLRMAFSLGVRSTGSRDHSFNIMVGSGTETFKDGTALNDFRFEFGATKGF